MKWTDQELFYDRYDWVIQYLLTRKSHSLLFYPNLPYSVSFSSSLDYYNAPKSLMLNLPRNPPSRGCGGVYARALPGLVPKVLDTS